MVQLILPMVLLGIFISVFQRERRNLEYTTKEWNQRERILVSYFVEAQQNKKESVVIPVEIAQKTSLGVNEGLGDISNWMKYHGYTDRVIPITVSSNQ